MEGGLVDPNIDVKKTSEAGPDDGDATACEVEKVGIIPRAVHTIFREGGCGGTRRYWVYVSHMEIYNERLFDLLAPEAATLAKASATNSSAAPSSTSGRSRSPTHRSPRITPGSSGSRPPQGIGLTIEEDRHVGVMVKGLTQVEVKSPEEIFAIIARSKNNRRTAETMCNVESSRSHGVFCVRVISAEPTPWGGEITRDGRLSLVDLSGSENIKRSGAVGDRAKEAAAIGQSLLALGRVIKALVKHAPHIPYRESKLTRVLGDSLGGNAFTAIILNITPNNGMLEETLNTLTYAKTAQSVRNTPKQHIANKTPTEKATIGTGDSSHLAPSSGVQNLSCNVVNELKRWRGDVKSRLLSSGSSRGAYISPWESQVRIDAPSHFSSTAGGRSPNTDGPSHQRRRNPSVLSSQPFADDVPSYQQGSDGGVAGDKVRKEVDKRRGIPIPSLQASVEVSLEDEGRRRSASETNLLSPAETAGASGVMPRGGWRGGGAPTFTADARDGLVSDSLERMPSTTRPGYLQHDRNSLRGVRSSGSGAGRRSGRKVTRRVFDSAAAEWVQTAVLEHTVSPRVDRPRQKPFVAERARRAKGHTSFTTEDDSGVSLTAEAKRAVEEVFDRYVPSGKPGRAFLLSAEVSALQEIWTRPDAEPPPPRLSPPPKRSLRKITQPSELSPNRGPVAFGLPEMSDNEALGTRVLMREAFVEFCRRAATRDAIFIRHFFVRSGYDCRLEAPPPPLGDDTKVDPVSPAWRPSPQRKRSTIVARRKSKDGATVRTRDSVEAVGSRPTSGRGKHEGPRRTVSRRHGSLTGGREKGEMPTSHAAARPKEQEPFENETDDIGCLTSGGMVDATELWLWMEDGRDHGERSRLDGLLSRGGGAHVSRSGVTAVVDMFSGAKCQNSSTTATTPVSCPKDQNRDVPLLAAVACPAMDESIAAGETSATVPLDKSSDPEFGRTPTGHTAAGNGKISCSDMTCDAANSATIIPEKHWEANAPLPEGARCAGRDASSSSDLKAETRSTICEWCGKLLTAAAVHSAAFCDFDDLS
ncbi:unnamed protein product [Ectocarpus sp. 8 AP-2014]